jgi:IS5 family transposase
MVYDKVVPKDHILRIIDKSVDFSFVNDLVKDAYCVDNGRPAWSPLLMFKVIFLQFLYDLSDYRIEEELNDRLSFKMFVGLDVEETPPDHSVISRFRDRLGPERFREIFNRVVSIARSKGLVSDRLHIIDSTDVKAKVDLYRLKKEHKDDDPTSYIDNHSPDKDARPGRKHKGVQFYGYKAHCVMDAQSEIIVNTDTTPGNVKDLKMLKPLTESSPPPKVITADKGYDCQDNHKYLSDRRIRNGIILKSNHTRKYLAVHVKRISNIAKTYRSLIEHKLADLKKHHGLRNARYWGTIKLRIQTYIATTCANIKRMAKLLFFGVSPPQICLRRAST